MSTQTTTNNFSWLYTSSNDNAYILVLIIIILGIIILDFGLIKHKINNFYNINKDNKDKDVFYNIADNVSNNLFISPEEKAKWGRAWVKLDGNEDTLFNNGPNATYENSITQLDSTLYNNGLGLGNTNSVQSVNYSTLGDYATLDSLGKSLTDTLGGISTNNGYTILDEQLGTFSKLSTPNPYAYDNTLNYNTGMNPNTVNGVSGSINGDVSGKGSGFNGKIMQDNRPIFMQKDFAGVANIFAPNIIVTNPPLNSDGTPDISFSM